MNLTAGRSSIVLTCAILFMSTVFLSPIFAQTSVVGNAINQSTWDNGVIANPPGDGSGNGRLMVGAWSSASQIQGPPAYSFAAFGPGGLPFASGSYPYSVNIGLAGDYQVVAWIDSPGAGTGGYDLGEPRSQGAAVTIVSNSVSGVNVTITDDFDADGLPDSWEVHYFANLTNPACTPALFHSRALIFSSAPALSVSSAVISAMMSIGRR